MSRKMTEEEIKERNFLLGKTDKDPLTGKTLSELRKAHDETENALLEAEKAKEQAMRDLRDEKMKEIETQMEKSKLAKAKEAEKAKEVEKPKEADKPK